MASEDTGVDLRTVRDMETYRALAKVLGMHAVQNGGTGLWYMVPLDEGFSVDTYLDHNPAIGAAVRAKGDSTQDGVRGRSTEFFCLWYFLSRNRMI